MFLVFHDMWWYLVTFGDIWWFFMTKPGCLSWYVMTYHELSWHVTNQFREVRLWTETPSGRINTILIDYINTWILGLSQFNKEQIISYSKYPVCTVSICSFYCTSIYTAMHQDILTPFNIWWKTVNLTCDTLALRPQAQGLSINYVTPKWAIFDPPSSM